MAAAAAAALPATAQAAPFEVGSAALTWQVPHEATPSTGTLSNYAVTIGHGNVAATAPATGTTITSASAKGPGTTYPFVFPSPTSGTVGTYDPDTKTGAIQLAGTLTFTAHDGTFFSVVNPKLQFDAPQSIRVVANGLVASGDVGSAGPPVEYGTASPARQTVFALDGTAAVTTANPDGSYTISNLIPSGTPQNAPTSYLSSNAAFNGVRPWFAIDRPNQAFSVTFAPKAAEEPEPVGDQESVGVSGTVAETLNLTLNGTTAGLGTFVLGQAADYDATVTGTASSTGPSKLFVSDTGEDPGFLRNGTAKLANPLKVCGSTAGSPCSYAALGASPLQLLTVPAGAATPLSVGLRQSISASEPLSVGSYSKTLTFTLSAGTP
ncbi:HtaA domain-containing protein [Conexibacter sp. SYSU D00693]|uniref:HtaA domain-containing protein n=1 Tax=Conexibacter sp. SYSU D00693 TaxID=2812560 RepID=UPI00196B7CC1|nr:HtaA domain-containing protein [Conexibacter sp. SYSU D00693]